MKEYIRQSILAYKSLYSWLNFPTYFCWKILNPILQTICFTLVTSYLFDSKRVLQTVVGNSYLAVTINVFFGIALIMREERGYGTLKDIFISPRSKIVIISQKVLINFLEGIFCMIVTLIVSFIIFGININMKILVIYIITAIIGMFSITGLGLILSSLGYIVRDLNVIMNIFNMIFLAISGANYPVNYLPVFFIKLSELFPLTRSIKAGQHLFIYGFNNYVGQLIFMEFIIGIIYIAIAVTVVKFFPIISKKYGTLEGI